MMAVKLATIKKGGIVDLKKILKNIRDFIVLKPALDGTPNNPEAPVVVPSDMTPVTRNLPSGEAAILEMAIWFGRDRVSAERLAEFAAGGSPTVVALVAAAHLKRGGGIIASLDRKGDHGRLLSSIKDNLETLEAINGRLHADRAGDLVYRYFHQSFKVFALQKMTDEAVTALQGLLPDRPLDPTLTIPVARGTGHEFSMEAHNGDWVGVPLSIISAFLLVREVVDFAIWSGRNLETAPDLLPERWAAVLDVFGVR
jgi:hypothetical protein